MTSRHGEAVCVVILAGGDGRRIGGGKPMRMLAGQTLLDRAIENARGWTSEIAVALRDPDQLEIAAGLPVILDEGEGGPIGALHAALLFAQHRRYQRLLTIPCDIPFVPHDLAQRLDAALGPATGPALPASGGRTHFACGLWKTSCCLAALPPYRAAEGSSLKGFVRQIGHHVVEWSSEPSDPFFNINSAADLRQAEALLRSR